MPSMTEAAIDVPLTCPRRGGCGLVTSWESAEDGKRYLRASCANCGRVITRLDEYLCQPSTLAADHTGRKVPNGCHRLGFIRSTDDVWRPVVRTESLPNRCDASLTCPMEGDWLWVPERGFA